MSTPPHLRSYVRGLARREHARAAEEAARRRGWRARLPELVRVLVDGHGARRVVLFGSLARDESGARSDIDILVSGIPLERLMDANAAANRTMGDVAVDLVPSEHARAEVLERAMQEGEVLHGGT